MQGWGITELTAIPMNNKVVKDFFMFISANASIKMKRHFRHTFALHFNFFLLSHRSHERRRAVRNDGIDARIESNSELSVAMLSVDQVNRYFNNVSFRISVKLPTCNRHK